MKTRINSIIFVILVLWFLQTIGFTKFHAGQIKTFNYEDFGTVTLGSILPKNYSIEVDWGNKIQNQKNGPEKIIVEITEFNNWDWRLLIPFYKIYKPKVRGIVKKESGEILGHIKMMERLEFYGIHGRGEIIDRVQKLFSNQIYEYIKKCQGDNIVAKRPAFMCQDRMDLAPAFFFSKKKLKGSKEKTYYCLKPYNEWVDTIFFQNYKLEIDSLISYETIEVNRDSGTIVQKRYYRDGQVFMIAKYHNKGREGNNQYFLNIRDYDNTGYSTNIGKIREFKTFERRNIRKVF